MVIHTVKGFGIVNKAEIDVFLELSCFFDDPIDVGNLISGSSAFSKSSLNIWKFMVYVLLKSDLEIFEHYFASVWDECNCAVVLILFGFAFLWDWNENWPSPVLWSLLSFPNLLAYWVHLYYFTCIYIWLPWWLSSKESACSAGDTGSITALGRSPGGGHGNPHQYSCLENPMDRGAWWAQSTGSQTETTEVANKQWWTYICIYIYRCVCVHMCIRGIHTYTWFPKKLYIALVFWVITPLHSDGPLQREGLKNLLL